MTTKTRRKGSELPDIAIVPAEMISIPDEAREQLRQVLLQQKLPQLRAIAGARQVPVRGSQRETLVSTLLDNLLDPAAQESIISGLGQPARALLAVGLVLNWTNNNVMPQDAQRVLHGIGEGTVEQALGQLQDLGLLVQPLTANPRYEVSRHLPAALAPGLLPILPEIHAYTGDLPAVREDSGDLARELRDAPALRKAEALLAALQAQEYRVADPGPRSYRGQPTHMLGRWEVMGEVPKAGPFYTKPNERPSGVQVAADAPLLAGDGLAQIQAAAGMDDPGETTFFLQLLLAQGLVIRNGRVLVVPAGNIESFRAQPPVARLTQLLVTALALNTWSELDPLLANDPGLALFRNSTLHYMEPLQMRNEVAHIRQAVAALLAWLPAGPWYDLDSLLGAVRHLFPELPLSLQPRAGGWEQVTWWLERADGTGGWQFLNRRNSADWMRGLGRLATVALGGPLSWLGLVETTNLDGSLPRADRYGALAGVRLTALGGALLTRRPAGLLRVQPLPAGASPQASRGPAIHFSAETEPTPRANLDPRATPLADQRTLATFADPIRMDEDLVIYRLTAGSVRRGFDHGLDGPAMLDFLGRLAGREGVPAPVAERIRGWWASYGRLRFYTGVSLISFNDEFTLAEVLASTNLSKYVLYQFSPRLIAVASGDVDRLLIELARAGQTPRVVDESLPSSVVRVGAA